MTKATIHDVAAAAGVGVATVDRVLNNRPGVREATRQKVKDAMRALRYRPNSFAARLSRSKTYRFLFILPRGDNRFIDTLRDAILAAAETAREEAIFIEVDYVESFSGQDLSAALERLSPDRCDGVAAVAPDVPLVRQAINDCLTRGVRVVTLVSDVPTSSRPFYVGIDNVSAGRVAGRLLGRFTAGRRGKLALVPGSLTLSDHMERMLGCSQIVRSHFPHLELLPPVEGRDEAEATERAVSGLLKKHRNGIIAIYNIGAGNPGLIAAVERSKRRDDIVVVAHELSSHMEKALLEGTIDAVLCQDAGYEVDRAVTLLRQLCDEEQNINNAFIRTDIYLPDNLP